MRTAHIQIMSLLGRDPLQLGPELPVNGHAGAAGEGVPPLVHELRVVPDQVLEELGLDQSEVSSSSVPANHSSPGRRGSCWCRSAAPRPSCR